MTYSAALKVTSRLTVLYLLNQHEMQVVPETGGVGSAGGSTDSCLNTAYLSEEVTEEEDEPDTGVNMAGVLQKKKTT